MTLNHTSGLLAVAIIVIVLMVANQKRISKLSRWSKFGSCKNGLQVRKRRVLEQGDDEPILTENKYCGPQPMDPNKFYNMMTKAGYFWPQEQHPNPACKYGPWSGELESGLCAIYGYFNRPLVSGDLAVCRATAVNMELQVDKENPLTIDGEVLTNECPNIWTRMPVKQ